MYLKQIIKTSTNLNLSFSQILSQQGKVNSIIWGSFWSPQSRLQFWGCTLKFICWLFFPPEGRVLISFKTPLEWEKILTLEFPPLATILHTFYTAVSSRRKKRHTSFFQKIGKSYFKIIPNSQKDTIYSFQNISWYWNKENYKTHWVIVLFCSILYI